MIRPAFPAWMDYALCADADPSDWFPESGDSSMAGAAKLICAECPVRLACLAWALENDCGHGVFGGMSATERQRMRKNLSATVCPDCGVTLFANGLGVHRARWCGQPTQHGHNLYARGLCRCMACRAGHADYERRRRAARKAS